MNRFWLKVLTFAKYESMNRQDEYLIDLFKTKLKPYGSELRTQNVDLSLYFAIQTVKCLPIALMFQDRFNLRDTKVEDELVHLIYSYLRK